MSLYLLDYGAGNVQSLANSLIKLGYSFKWISSPEDFDKADKLIFPGVGAFHSAIENLTAKGLIQPLQNYLLSGRPYFGICIGLQILFASSLENPSVNGLGVIPTAIERFSNEDLTPSGKVVRKSVPHMGWNSIEFLDPNESNKEGLDEAESYYFVHSYRATYDYTGPVSEWTHSTTQYGQEVFVATVRRANIFATQFHPEKSGAAGLRLLDTWLRSTADAGPTFSLVPRQPIPRPPKSKHGLTRRIIACLDVRANDQGDLVVTKGDQYDVREKNEPGAKANVAGAVRNLGKPVALAARYFASGADELCLLNITSFRNSPLQDQPMLAVVRAAAEEVFVPLTIGGGIKDTVDPDGTPRSALEVAGAYFRAGADKVSIGSEAVIAVEKMLQRGDDGDGTSAIETIAAAYGRQAVVVSIDPRRVYVDADYDGPYRSEVIAGKEGDEQGKHWWYQCTVSGGRESRPLSVVQLAVGVEKLGAGEILVNSIDRDGTGRGFDLDLIKLVRRSVGIPVVASSGAGKAGHFVDVFAETDVEAALAAGIFHRHEVEISAVKDALKQDGQPVRK